jgi:hypothetical protein
VRALGIKSSDDAHAPGSFGDPRGARALEVALAVAGPGYHAYLCDLEGTDRLERVAALVRPMLRSEKTLWDWVYVHNFLDANRPRAIRLTAGEGRQLRGEIEALLRGLRDDLPKAFREEAFESEKSSVVESFEQRARTRRDELAEMGKRAGFTLVFAPDGNIAAVPMLDGRPIASEEEFKQLDPERIAALEKGRKALAADLREFMARQFDERRKLDEEIGRIEREFAGRIVRSRIGELAGRHANPELQEHLGQMAEHILDHLEPFRGGSTPSTSPSTTARPVRPACWSWTARPTRTSSA